MSVNPMGVESLPQTPFSWAPETISSRAPSPAVAMLAEGLLSFEDPEQPQWLCQPFTLYRLIEDGDQLEQLLVAFTTRQGESRQVVVACADLYGSQFRVVRKLVEKGFALANTPRALKLLLEFLCCHEPRDIAQRLRRPGRHGHCYLLEGEVLGHSPVLLLADQLPTQDRHPRQRGSLEEWQQGLQLCAGNTLPLFVVGLAFSAPLLGLLGHPTIGFHLYGPSSLGKTTLLKLANSVWGSPVRLRSWNTTRAGLEQLSYRYRDALLPLDEFEQAARRDRGAMIYQLGNDQGRTRAQGPGEQTQLVVLSTGELSVRATLEQGGERCQTGHLMRLIDLPIAQLPLLQLHGLEGPGAFMEGLERLACNYYGTPIRAFLDQLMADDHQGLAEQFQAEFPGFLAQMEIPESAAQHRRVAKALYLVAFAGELAGRYQVSGLAPGVITGTCRELFELWRQQQEGFTSQEARQVVTQVRQFIARHGLSRFVDLSLPKAEQQRLAQRSQLAGFRRELYGAQHHFVVREVFETEVLAGLDKALAIRVLCARGWLIPGVDGPTVPHRFPRGAESVRRFYHLDNVLGES